MPRGRGYARVRRSGRSCERIGKPSSWTRNTRTRTLTSAAATGAIGCLSGANDPRTLDRALQLEQQPIALDDSLASPTGYWAKPICSKSSMIRPPPRPSVPLPSIRTPLLAIQLLRTYWIRQRSRRKSLAWRRRPCASIPEIWSATYSTKPGPTARWGGMRTRFPSSSDTSPAIPITGRLTVYSSLTILGWVARRRPGRSGGSSAD